MANISQRSKKSKGGKS